MENKLPALNFPEFEFKVLQEQQVSKIFDTIRNKWVTLTPEEWVRQHLIRFMSIHLSYPTGLIAVEKQMQINGMIKRFDIMVYDRSGSPWMVAECKAPEKRRISDAAYQASMYARGVKSRFITISNGFDHLCFEMVNDKFQPLKEFPVFETDTAMR